MSEVKTPKELADAVRDALPYWGKTAAEAVAELERMACTAGVYRADWNTLGARVDRLEEKVAAPRCVITVDNDTENAIRERKAWDTIEAWIDRAPDGEARDAAFRKSRHPRALRDRVLIISERSGLFEDERQGVSGNRWRHKTVRRDTRVEALEAAAEWCEGQK